MASSNASKTSPCSDTMHLAIVGLVEVEVALSHQPHEVVHHIRKLQKCRPITDLEAFQHRTEGVSVDENQVEPFELLVATRGILTPGEQPEARKCILKGRFPLQCLIASRTYVQEHK